MDCKENKYIYYWIIQGYYCGWEDLSFYDKKETRYLDVLHDLREYRYMDGHAKRVIERRELNPKYRGGTVETVTIEISA